MNFLTITRRTTFISYYALDTRGMTCDASTEFSYHLVSFERLHRWACATPVDLYALALAHSSTRLHDMQAMTSTGYTDTATAMLAGVVLLSGQA